jgi:hypothetical protein
MPFKPREITTPTAEGSWVTAEWINAPQVYFIRHTDGEKKGREPIRAIDRSGIMSQHLEGLLQIPNCRVG